MYDNKAEKMMDFVELLRCQNYDEVFSLKKSIGEDRFRELEEMYERLKEEDQIDVVGSSIEVYDQEKVVDLSRLEDMEKDLIDILRMMLCTTTSELSSLRLSSKNYYVVETYHDIYNYLKMYPDHTPLIVRIKVSSLVSDITKNKK